MTRNSDAFAPARRDEFDLMGITRLDGAVPEAAVRAISNRIWEFLEKKYRIERDAPSTWRIERPTGFQALTRTDAFAQVCSARVVIAIDQLLGHGQWRMPVHWGAPLVTFPAGDHWSLPADQWHLDFEVDHWSRLPGVRLLALLSDTSAQGGTTMVASGSHRLLTELKRRDELLPSKSAEIRKVLMRKYAWFRLLCSRGVSEPQRMTLMDDVTTVEGIELRVIPLEGKPGDVFLMHPWAFHAPSANCTPIPRMMISESVFRQ